jgi:hypothetical protein
MIEKDTPTAVVGVVTKNRSHPVSPLTNNGGKSNHLQYNPASARLIEKRNAPSHDKG